MNIKVLILPDGDDPDSFARKHTATDFKQYIADHQTDFIQFKSDLLLKGVTDPIKRSEAINSIVKSISVIKDPVVRDTYITDCSHRLGINEATLILQLNKFIRSGQEEQRKEANRSLQQAQATAGIQSGASASGGNAVPDAATPLRPATPEQQAGKVETMLVQMVVRHGGEVIYKDVEIGDGQVVERLTVAQYIYYSLADDNLSLGNELYNRILQEAANQSVGEEEFNSEQYFTHHEDVAVSQLAASLCVDHFQLSKSQQVRCDTDTLREQTQRLLLDFRLDYAEARLRELKQAISLAVSNPQQLMSLMEQYKDVQNIRNTLAKKLGNNIVV